MKVVYEGGLTAREHAIVFAHIWQERHPKNTTAYQAIVGLLGLLPFEELSAAIQKAPHAIALRADMENHERQFEAVAFASGQEKEIPEWRSIIRDTMAELTSFSKVLRQIGRPGRSETIDALVQRIRRACDPDLADRIEIKAAKLGQLPAESEK